MEWPNEKQVIAYLMYGYQDTGLIFYQLLDSYLQSWRYNLKSKLYLHASIKP